MSTLLQKHMAEAVAVDNNQVPALAITSRDGGTESAYLVQLGLLPNSGSPVIMTSSYGGPSKYTLALAEVERGETGHVVDFGEAESIRSDNAVHMAFILKETIAKLRVEHLIPEGVDSYGQNTVVRVELGDETKQARVLEIVQGFGIHGVDFKDMTPDELSEVDPAPEKTRKIADFLGRLKLRVPVIDLSGFPNNPRFRH